MPEVDWALWLEPNQPVSRLVELARLAESLGAVACFVADEGTDRDLWVALTAIACKTGLRVAPAITNPFSRHPVATAAAVATLAEFAPGRVWHGLGVGGSRVLGPLGITPSKPYTALKDALEVNQRLLSGETVGEASLPWFDGDVPVAVAGRGPRVQRLAAQRADWIILSAAAVADLPDTAELVRSRGSAGIAWSAYIAYDDSERRRVLRHFTYMAVDAPTEVRHAAGLDDRTVESLRSLILSGQYRQAAELLPDALVDIYGLAGTPAQIAATIAALRPHYDLFVLPLNERAGAESHIRRCAAILDDGARRIQAQAV